MAGSGAEAVLGHLSRWLDERRTSQDDGRLLARFVAQRDEDAFAELVARHGPLVFGICRRVLHNVQDAEDVFQATFLVLARKAATIRKPESLSCWLHGVAYRLALKAKTEAERRRLREQQAVLLPNSVETDLSWGDIRGAIDEELQRLPEKQRLPLVLCYLEGLTQDEAARRLGWPRGTLKRRLESGRERLRIRLTQRGITLGTGLFAVALTESASRGSISLTLRLATVKAAVSFISGDAGTMTATHAALLAQGALQTMLTTKLKLGALLILLLCGAGTISGLAMPQSKTLRQAEKNAAASAPPRIAESKLVRKDRYDDPLPEGAIARLGTVRFNHGDGLNALFFSPDGKTIISEGNGSIRVWDATNGKERDRIRTTKTFSTNDRCVLLADGKTFLSLTEFWEGDNFTSWDLSEKKKTRDLMLPVRRTVSSVDHRNALSPDGKLAALHVDTPAQVQVFDLTTGKNLYQLGKGEKEFLAVTFAGNNRIVSVDAKQRIDVWEARSGKLLRHFSHDAPIRYLLASPDGRWLASLTQRPSPYGGQSVKQEAVYLWDLRSDTVTQTLRAKPGHWFTNVCFAPDGKSLLTSSRSDWDADDVILWDRETGRRLLEFDKDGGINADVATISPDGSRLAAGDRAGKFELWDLKTGHRLTSDDSRYTQVAAVLISPNAQVAAVDLSPTGDRATLIGQKTISSWDATNGRRLEAFSLAKDVRSLWVRARSVDGRYAVSYSLVNKEGPPLPPGQAAICEVCIHVWDLPARKCLYTLRAPAGQQQIGNVSCAFAADSSVLASWHPDKQTLVRLWDVRSGKLIRSFEEKKAGWPGKMNFTADGKTVFVVGKHVVAYEVAGGKELFSWRLKPAHNPLAPRTAAVGGAPENEDDRIGWGTLAVSPEGTVIAATPWPGSAVPRSKEDAIALYDAQTGKLLRRCNDPSLTNNSFKQLVFSADSKLLASSNGTIVHLWEVATGKLIQSFKGHQGDIDALAFSRDGRCFASASRDSTVLIWDATGSPVRLTTDAALEESWKALIGDDARRAHDAVWALALTPDNSIPLLKDRLRPVKAVSREQLDRLMKDLDSDRFAVREKATAELHKLGELAEPSLRRALANKPTLEQRRRIEPMLADLEAKLPSGETLRSLRAVRVLEHAGTAETLRLLRELAEGAEGAALTREAQAALARLKRGY